MLGCCWISWAETRLRPSERAIFFTLQGPLSAVADIRWHSHTGTLRRYHIGRHVGNLQVTNTYEGTFVSGSHRIISPRFSIYRISTGYSHPHGWESDNRYSSFYVTYCEAISRRKGMKEDNIHYKHSKAYKTKHTYSNISTERTLT